MKYFSVFSGVGGFELAIEKVYDKNSGLARERECNSSTPRGQEAVNRVGVGDTQTIGNINLSRSGKYSTCVGFSEIDKYAISVYQYHYQSHKNYGDISKIDWNTVPDFDLLVGGSPCQDFSIAGKREGIGGIRSGLIWEYIRVLQEKKPTNFIWENVKGVMSSRKGFDFGSILTAFSEAGYDCEWQVLNARDFGVPQNRERIFVVGHLRGKSRPKVFPITTSSQKNVIQINSSDWRGANRNQRQTTIRQPLKFLQRNQKNIEGDYAFTVDSANTGGVKVDTKIRRLTPLECERLMSWPDEWTKFGTDINVPISDTQRYKMCGNGVVSKVVEAIIERL